MYRRLLISATVFLVLCLGIASMVSAYALVDDRDKSCDSFSASGTTDAPYVAMEVKKFNGIGWDLLVYEVFPANGTFNHTLSFEEQEEGTILGYLVWGSLSNTPAWDLGQYYYSEQLCESDDGGSEAGPPCENLFDGRLNDHQGLDCAAPVAIYLNEELGTVDIYAVNPDTGEGTLVIRQSSAGTSQVDSNQTVESVVNPFTGATISLYWLTSDEWELRTTYSDGKWYDFVWNADGVRYHLAA